MHTIHNDLTSELVENDLTRNIKHSSKKMLTGIELT